MPGLVCRAGSGRRQAARRACTWMRRSDEAIVLAKRLNKGRQLPAEVVEGRASPKGNSRKAAAVRTLSRYAASIRIMAARRTTSETKSFIARRLTRGRSPVR